MQCHPQRRVVVAEFGKPWVVFRRELDPEREVLINSDHFCAVSDLMCEHL